MDVVEVVLATGLVGNLLVWGWRWCRRPRLTICFDPDQQPRSSHRRGLRWDQEAGGSAWAWVREYVAYVGNEGGRTARDVEAEVEILERRRHGAWSAEDPLRQPDPLVWTGTASTRAHVAPSDEADRRRLSVFVLGPTNDPHIYPATLANAASDVLTWTPMSWEGNRVRITVRAAGADPASCELEIALSEEDSIRPRISSERPCDG